jgi:hypothetical protein
MSEQFIQIQSLPTIIDLEDEALQDAGSSRGNSKVFLNKLNSILLDSVYWCIKFVHASVGTNLLKRVT